MTSVSRWAVSAVLMMCLSVGASHAVRAASPSTIPSAHSQLAQKAEAFSIRGFRSAMFGMTTAQVLNAIDADFKTAEKDVAKITNEAEKTQGLAILVDNLIPESGKAQVVYIFGYKSKRLIQVNVQWGWPADRNVKPENIVSTANVLRQHFASKPFVQDGLLMNVPIQEDTVIVFRGSDEAGRMALLHLSSKSVTIEEANDLKTTKTVPAVTLRLSYISDPKNPDVFSLEPGAF